MTNTDLPTQLENALGQLDMAQKTLTTALAHAHLSALHSTYTAAIKRILANNQRSIHSMNNLLRTLQRHARHPKL